MLGYVQVVDGRDVSTLGSSFDVLPGPHEVQTPSRWAHTELNVGGMYWITGHLTYSILMKPGYSYTIKVQMEKTGGDTYRGHIRAYESNSEGVMTRDFYPIASHEGA